MSAPYKKLHIEVKFTPDEESNLFNFQTKTTLLIKDGREMIVFENHRPELPSVQEEADGAYAHLRNAQIKCCK